MGLGQAASKAAGLIPGGKAGLAIKIGVGLLLSALWTAGPGADEAAAEASDFKANHERRRGYNRHYALKGRGRKEAFRQNAKEDGARLMPKRPYCESVKG